LIIPKTQLFLYGFNKKEARSLGMVEFPVHADPFNVGTKFNILDASSPYNAILERPWIYMMRVVPSIPQAIQNSQYKRRPGDGHNSCCSSLREIGLDEKSFPSRV